MDIIHKQTSPQRNDTMNINFLKKLKTRPQLNKKILHLQYTNLRVFRNIIKKRKNVGQNVRLFIFSPTRYLLKFVFYSNPHRASGT